MDFYPLSPIQQGMLFHWLLDRNSGTDVEQIVADLGEPVDEARLQAAWQHAVDRFTTLRSRFEWENREAPVQGIAASAKLPFRFEDVSSRSAQAAEDRIAQFLRQDRRDGLDLTQAPAMRVTLFKLAESHYRMVWTFHHILIDGRSFEIILRSVFDEYDGVASAPAAEDKPYRALIDWIGKQDFSPSRTFWREHLRGVSAPTVLPADHAVVTGGSKYGEREIVFPADVTGKLRELATREGLSLNTIVMAAWALLLSRYSSESDVILGATKTTRRGTIPDGDSTVGIFLATIPVRIGVDHQQSITSWLKHVREVWTSLRGHEHLPLVDIRNESEVPASSQLFDSLVVFENYQFGTRLQGLGGKWAKRSFGIREQTGFPVTLLAYGDEHLVLRLEYDARRFDDITATRMAGHVATVLNAWANDVAGPLWRTPMLTAEERKVIVGDWNATSSAYPLDVPLAALVERTVEEWPDSPAVTFEKQTITYRELNTRANRLAAELGKRGAGAGTLVGLSVERSIDMMIALLAIIKAGGAYVPLDPAFPRDRLAYMMDDSELPILITQSHLRESLPPFEGTVLELDRCTWDSNSSANPDVAVSPDDLAVVIYTSGSTGKPKGVQTSRGAMINLLWSMKEWLALTPNDRLLAVTTISFDIAGADIWLPWLTGAHTIVASREAAADGAQLRNLIDRHDITFLQATPITWRLLLEAGWTGKRDMQGVSTGEGMPPEIAAAIVPILGKTWNLYGPTETTIWSTGTRVERAHERISIGKPVANTQCYILDPHQQPVPAGVIGELYIAGDGLARGYLKRPDLDVEKFISDPFASDPSARMYRTGDLARYLADGTIECLGRTDHQVKIRGYRIELGEIEIVLGRHPGVKQAVVMAREDTPGEKRLAAYVVPNENPVDTAELRALCKANLPEYMVPAAIVNLPVMPLTANGKVDRRALPKPDDVSSESSVNVVAARTQVESTLTELWEEIFKRPGIGVTEDFFALGGHSILAVRLMSRVRQVFGKQLPLNALFESPTIEQLAKKIDTADRTMGKHSIITIQASGTLPPLFWIPGGAALGMFRLRHVITQLGENQPVYGLGSAQPETIKDVETVEQRAENYLQLIRRVHPHGPYAFAGFCAGGHVALEIAQQLESQGEKVSFVGMINTGYPNHPSSRSGQLMAKVQRLKHQVRVAAEQGVGLAGYVRAKLAERRMANADRAELEKAKAQVQKSGFQEEVGTHQQVLLNQIFDVFGRYQPKYYSGKVTQFISNDEAYVGLSKALDARYEWRKRASEFEIQAVEGGHDDLLDSAHSSNFATLLRAALEAAAKRL